MEYDTIRLSTEGPVATLTLNRPDALNAVSPRMVEELTHAVSEVEARGEVKALVIRDYPRLAGFIEKVNAFLFRLENLPLPTIAVVQGYALAGGLELMLACDMVIASEDARIGDQHANYGLAPGGGSTQRLPRKVGVQRAMEILLTGRWLSGKEAEGCGLVLRAVPAAQLEEELEKLLSGLRDKSRAGLACIKRATIKGQNMTLRCCRSTILSVGSCSGKMSVYGRTDIEYERAEPVTYLERSIRAALDDEGGGPAAWSKVNVRDGECWRPIVRKGPEEWCIRTGAGCHPTRLQRPSSSRWRAWPKNATRGSTIPICPPPRPAPGRYATLGSLRYPRTQEP